MRRSASEIINGLEGRIARLENMKGKTEILKQAGAMDFMNYSQGTNARQAFRDIQEEMDAEYGQDAYSGHIGLKSDFTMATREVMSSTHAEDYAKRNIERYGKWDDAGCVAVGEEKVLTFKEFSVEVKAKNENEAREIVTEKMMRGKNRAGATVEVYIYRHGDKAPVLSTPAGKKKFVPHKLTGKTLYRYTVRHEAFQFETKKEAVTSLKGVMNQDRFIREGEVVEIHQNKVVGGLSYENSSKLPTYTVKGKRIQKKIGKVIGYYFFGYAPS
jgi:hypothetical protein